ncbi:MAG: HlyD family efflux transporter periplasmic adaptor subunit [Oscillospiraceae bacterium]|nr:HlyD family efflux transporter periplasmic adaptor subunit [Oscillospiraceae bacterium]
MSKIKVILLILLISTFIGISVNLNKIKFANATTLKKIEYVNDINVVGEFESLNKTQIKLSYPIIVKEIYVNENEYINQGQAIFSIDIDKMQSVLNGNITSEVANQLSGINIAEVNDNKILSYIADDTIYSPVNGIITEHNLYEGAVILKNNNIVTLSDTDTLYAKFSLSQQDFGKVKVGDTVIIKSAAFPEKIYYGEISDKNAVVRKQVSVTGTNVVIDVFAEIKNPDDNITEGLQLSGKITADKNEVKNMLEHRYINQDSGGEFVFVLKNGSAEKTYVTCGVENTDYTEILTHFGNDTIFLDGNLKSGDRVIIANE